MWEHIVVTMWVLVRCTIWVSKLGVGRFLVDRHVRYRAICDPYSTTHCAGMHMRVARTLHTSQARARAAGAVGWQGGSFFTPTWDVNSRPVNMSLSLNFSPEDSSEPNHLVFGTGTNSIIVQYLLKGHLRS